MNYNIIAYIIYLSLMIFIIVYVGRYFFTNGRVFILSLLNNDEEQTDHINRILLIGYCLFNIGYGFMTIQTWDIVRDAGAMIASLAENLAILIIILAVTHYLNMTAIYLVSKSKSNSLTNKSLLL